MKSSIVFIIKNKQFRINNAQIYINKIKNK